MSNSSTLRAQRRAAIQNLTYVAVGGIALLVVAATTAFWLSTQT